MRKFYFILLFVAFCLETNAQYTWTSIPNIPGLDYDITDVEVIDANTLYVASSYYQSYPRARLHFSNDGGQTWTEKYNTSTTYPNGVGVTFKVSFINQNVGFFIMSKTSYKIFGKTTDGGATWTTKTLNFCGSCGDNMYDLFFKDANNGVVITNVGIMYTNNGGDSWSLSNSSDKPVNMKINRATGLGYAVKSGSTVSAVRTSDYGLTWDTVLTLPVNGSVSRYFNDADSGVFVGIYDYGNSGFPSGTEGAIYRTPIGSGVSQRLYQNVLEYTAVGVLDNSTMFLYNRQNNKVYDVYNYRNVNPAPTFVENFTAPEAINQFVMKDGYGYAYTFNKLIYKLNNANLGVDDNVFSPDDLVVSSDENGFTVGINNAYFGKVETTLFDINGKLIKKTEVNKNAMNFFYTIECAEESKGVYILKTTMGNEVITKKGVK